MTDDLSMPARSLFPGYRQIHPLFAAEVEDLTEEQIDRQRPDKSWGLWSIRYQVSHVASIPYRWLLFRWGPTLFGENLPRDKSLADTGGAERMLDPARFHAMADLLAALEDSYALAWEVLGNETLGSLREKEIPDRIPADARRPPAFELVRDWREKISMPAHPNGIRIDPENPGVYHYNLEYTFRHMLWEAYAHLKTIQMHKRAEGLPAKADIPEEGYLKVLTWE